MQSQGISILIPTFNRPLELKSCLENILARCPEQYEIIVHIDYGDCQTEIFLRQSSYHLVRWFISTSPQGPGGGRNKLIKQAQFPIVASFDDDSWPLSQNYFKIATELFASNPNAAVFSAQEIRPSTTLIESKTTITPISSFQNCACLIRREAFLQTQGYLPLRYAYGMEEADVALQLLDRGWQILEAPQLRVFHDTELTHHASPAINAAHITNTALLAYLRYPASYWPLGMAQVLSRVRYAAKVDRWQGIGQGLRQIPGTLWKYRHHRHPVRSETLAHSRQLARHQGSLAE